MTTVKTNMTALCTTFSNSRLQLN